MVRAINAKKKYQASGYNKTGGFMKNEKFVKNGACRITWIAVLILLNMQACNARKAVQENVRQPAVAGSFYPGDPQQLSQMVNQCLNQNEKISLDGKIIGLLVPHAGYLYSAPTAAAGYKQVQNGGYELVVVIAPSHHDRFNGATIYPGTGYQTPMGIATIDTQVAQKLVDACPDVQFSNLGHGQEHAVEVQLPFIQTVLPKAKILPIDVGMYDWQICERIGKALAKVLSGKNALIVASSDLYHGENYDELVQTDATTLSAVVNMNPSTLCTGLLQDQYQACGGGPAVIMQVAAMALGANQAKLLARTNSGDVTGQKNGYVVGYGAVAVYTGTKATAAVSDSKPQNGRREFKPLELKVQKELLKMARQAIEHYLATGEQKQFKSVFPSMDDKRGVFVTITEGGDLRGCIGHHEADQPLYVMVPQMAVAAAFSDPRFPELRKEELNKIKIKISAYLTNVYRINSLDEFEMGKQGIIMYKGGKGATFLPEVPAEAGWKTKEEEMTYLCRKAGLSADAWKEGAEFWVYETQVFDETIL
jgi:MEMO1 family protein